MEGQELVGQGEQPSAIRHSDGYSLAAGAPGHLPPAGTDRGTPIPEERNDIAEKGTVGPS